MKVVRFPAPVGKWRSLNSELTIIGRCHLDKRADAWLGRSVGKPVWLLLRSFATAIAALWEKAGLGFNVDSLTVLSQLSLHLRRPG